MRNTWTAGLALLLLAGVASADKSILDKTTTGTPILQSIDVVRFAPGGVLLIGDGRGSQVIAVELAEPVNKAGFNEEIARIDTKLAGKLGSPVKGTEIVDMAVNPVSHTAYIALRMQANRKPVILTIAGDGKIGELTLENVKYAKIDLPTGTKANLSKVSDLAWAGDRLLVAGLANEEFASKIFTVPAPLAHEAKAAVYSTETFHVAHNKWETRAPMTVLMPYEEEGKKFLAGSFACTPVVKYPLDDVKPGEKVKGISMIEMGSGNRPLNMFAYEKGGKSYVLMNTQRFHHARAPVGPSPYWTVVFERDLLSGKEKVNDKALWRIDKKDSKLTPLTDRIKVADDYHGVMHMDRLDSERALTIKDDGKGGLTLVALKLP